MTSQFTLSLVSLPSLNRRDFINSGGVGDVFLDPQRPGWCIKKFHRPLVGDEAHNLVRLSSLFGSLRPSEISYLQSRFSWPVDLFGARDRIVGFAMPLAPGTAYFDLQVAGKRTRQLLQAKYLIDKNYWSSAAVQSSQPALTRDARLQLCQDVVFAINLITELGLAYGDVSGNNLCAALDHIPTVFFLDADSLEFADNPVTGSVTTVDWVSPVVDDRVRRTRSLGALLVWRLLSENPTSYPKPSGSVDPSRASPLLLNAISDCYEQGDVVDLRLIGKLLSDALTSTARHEVVQRALDSKFARPILQIIERPHDAWEAAILDAASRHVDAEHRIEESSTTRQRLMIQKYLATPSAFVLDLSPSVHRLAPPRSEEELHALALEARFLEIARFFVKGDLLDLEDSSTAARSVGHALADTGDIPTTAVTSPGAVTLRWSWPTTDFVNCAEVSARGISGQATSHRLKRGAGRETQYSIKLPTGGTVSSSVKFGCISPTGVFVPSSAEQHLLIDIPPELQRSRSSLGGASRNALASVPVFQINPGDLVDDGAAILALKRSKRRRLALLGGVAALLLSGLVVIGVIRDSERQPLVDICLVKRRLTPPQPLISC